MGKGAIIGAIALSFLAIMTLMNTQSISRETSDRQVGFQTGYMAKELAMKGRKLVISSWVNTGGTSANDIGTLHEDGGTMSLLSDSTKILTGDSIEFTVRGVYDGAVHDVTSRLGYNGAPPTSPLQMKVPDLNMSISSTATLDMSLMAIDTQSLEDLEQIIVTDLGLAGSLGALGLGADDMRIEVETELDNAFGAGHGIDVLMIDEDMRSEFEEDQGGYPDQVIQMINAYANTHPGSQTTLPNDTSLPSTFGSGSDVILRVEDSVNLSSDLTGAGVLIIEGDFTVPDGVTFNWDGIVVVAPPASHLSGFIDLSGIVNITGSLVVAQEGVPNTGHMDLTIHTDPYSNWSNPWGYYGDSGNPWWKHTHDFSGSYGAQVGFTSTHAGFTVHSTQTLFDTFLGTFSATDQLIFELYNPQNHGLSTLTMDLTSTGITSSNVAAGFDESIKSPTDEYRTIPIQVDDIQHIDIVVNRLSSLRKMWDDGNSWPGCAGVDNTASAPLCVSASYPTRYGSLALRVFEWDGFSAQHVYDANLYWHRREDEEEDHENEMANLLTDIQSNNYGMDINIGDNTTLIADPGVMGIIGGTGGTGGSITNLGTWHRHWDADDAYNPLTVSP